MAGHSTKLQVSGYRFLLRRMEHALVRGDTRMLDDPIRAQGLSFVTGAVIAVIITAVCIVLAYLKPPGTLGNAQIFLVRESGALYVRVGDVVHPVLNLASARLIAGAATDPEAVSAAAVNSAKRGPLVGIPGAPAQVSAPFGQDESGWAVCDEESRTTVIAGNLPGRASTSGVLVTPRSESAAITYLLYGGWRAQVDLRDRAVVRALRLDNVVPHPVSRALLDATPEAPPIRAPRIVGAGSPSPLRGIPVGTVVRVIRADADEYYVVLAQGVQRIGQVVADLIRFTDSRSDRDITTVAPDSIAAMPILDTLTVTAFPQRSGVSDGAVVCTRWQPNAAGAESSVISMDSLPVSAAMDLTQADAEGPLVDAFAMAPGRSAYVRAAGVGGEATNSAALYYVNDSGVAFGIADEGAAKHLGLSGAPMPAPWPVLSWLPRGPELSRDAASVARDSVAGSP
jgi:type VII secretion protein EccB